MIVRFPMPRLLPATICVLAFAVAARCIELARSAILDGQPAALITAVWAAGVEARAEKAAPPERKPAPLETPKPEVRPSPQEEPPPIADGERAVLLELRERRKELEARDAWLASRESILAAAEMKLSSRLEELSALQQKLESLEADRKQQEDTAWRGLVKVYETMKPRDAAAIFNDLGMPVLFAVIDRMKEAKAAAILAAMVPEKAREVTTQLAAARSKGSGLVNGGKPAISADPGKAQGSGS